MPRVTVAMVRVAQALRLEGGLCGAEMSRRCRIGSGTLYPALMRMEDAGWLSSRWEEGDPATMGRPRRRFYDLTDGGAQAVVL